MSAPPPPPIHRLGWDDMPALERHLLSLGPADRRKRFLQPADDAAVARHVARLDPGRDVLLGAADGNGRLVGAAEARPLPGLPGRRVEVAVSVHPYHRREGLGRRLAEAAVALAFAGGAEAAVLLFAPGDRSVSLAVRSLGARVTAPGRALLVAGAVEANGPGRRAA